MLVSVEERIKGIEEELSRVSKALKNAPPGRLSCSTVRGFKQFYQTTGTVTEGTFKKTYLHKDQQSLIKLLAQKAYLKAKLKDLDCELAALKAFSKEYCSDYFIERFRSQSPGVFELVASLPFIKENQFSAWEQSEYPSHPKNFEPRLVPTVKGFKVSSKSEGAIADELARRGFAIHYEEDLNLNGYFCNADFVVKEPVTGKQIIIEHFGMMDDPGYRQHAAEKISRYILSGYTPGEDIIFTYETRKTPMSAAKVREIFDYYFGKLR